MAKPNSYNAGRALAKVRWGTRLSRAETRKAAERLMARLHTRAAVAGFCGVSPMTVGNWLNGKTPAPSSILELCNKVTQLAESQETP